METMNKTFGKSQINRMLFESLPCPICTDNITDEQMQELAEFVEREVRNEYPELADKMFALWAKEEKTDEEYDFLYEDCDRASELWWKLIEDYIVGELGAVYYEDME